LSAAGFAGAAGAGVTGWDFATVAFAVAGFPAAAGFSSSAMMRRIDARISSIEGSWTFAGCVMSNSKSSRPAPVFWHQAIEDFPVPDADSDFDRKPDLPPDRALRIDTGIDTPPRTSAAGR
jgi:hypothetical protein